MNKLERAVYEMFQISPYSIDAAFVTKAYNKLLTERVPVSVLESNLKEINERRIRAGASLVFVRYFGATNIYYATIKDKN